LPEIKFRSTRCLFQFELFVLRPRGLLPLHFLRCLCFLLIWCGGIIAFFVFINSSVLRVLLHRFVFLDLFYFFPWWKVSKNCLKIKKLEPPVPVPQLELFVLSPTRVDCCHFTFIVFFMLLFMAVEVVNWNVY
jgi:hypothetical protein